MPENSLHKIEEPVVFLTGHRKCGTTMFQDLFDGHKSLCCYPADLGVLYAYYPYFISESRTDQELLNRLDRVACGTLEYKIDKSNIKNIDINKFRTDFFSHLKDKNLKDPKIVIKAMMDSWYKLVNKQENQLTVLKETSVDIYAKDLFEWFADLRIIQLVRDPRDNYAAIKAGVEGYYSLFGEGEKESLASVIHRASLDMKMALINRERFGNERYLIVRFENVVQDTENTMRKVASFLGIEFNECLCTPTVCGESTSGNNFDKEKMYSVSNKNLGRWRERISAEEAKIIEFHFGEIMQEFGYQPEFSTLEQADAQAEFYKWMNYKYFYKDSFKEVL